MAIKMIRRLLKIDDMTYYGMVMDGNIKSKSKLFNYLFKCECKFARRQDDKNNKILFHYLKLELNKHKVKELEDFYFKNQNRFKHKDYNAAQNYFKDILTDLHNDKEYVKKYAPKFRNNKNKLGTFLGDEEIQEKELYKTLNNPYENLLSVTLKTTRELRNIESSIGTLLGWLKIMGAYYKKNNLSIGELFLELYEYGDKNFPRGTGCEKEFINKISQTLVFSNFHKEAIDVDKQILEYFIKENEELKYFYEEGKIS